MPRAKRFESVTALVGKVEWEGGLLEAMFGYGIDAEDLPLDTPENIKTAWAAVRGVRQEICLIEEWLEDEADG